MGNIEMENVEMMIESAKAQVNESAVSELEPVIEDTLYEVERERPEEAIARELGISKKKRKKRRGPTRSLLLMVEEKDRDGEIVLREYDPRMRGKFKSALDAENWLRHAEIKGLGEDGLVFRLISTQWGPWPVYRRIANVIGKAME